jgi:hypothetical protein
VIDRWGFQVLGAVLLVAGTPPVQAATIQAFFVQELYSSSIQRDVSDGAGFITTNVGLFRFQRTGGTEPGFQVFDFYGFCIEPREFVSPGSTYLYDLAALDQGATNIGGMGVSRANLLRELYARFFPDFWNPQALDSTTAGALQIATWEIVRETSGTLDALTGTTQFRNPANPAALTLAQTYLSALTGAPDAPSLANLHALIRVGAQDIVIQDTPEPAGMAVAGLALLALGHFGRKRRTGRG